MPVDIGGSVESGFEAVRDAFVKNFDEFGEVGAGYAFYVEGSKVVDLWAVNAPTLPRGH